MIRGIYTAASALRAATIHQGRLAHNLTNLQTTGFKQVLTARQAYELQAMGRYSGNNAQYLSTVGGLEQGLLVPEEIIDFAQGNLEMTDRPLDLAIEGNGFFRVQTPDGDRYTRDGSFHRDSEGQLVTRDGYYVLDANGDPLVLPAGAPTILRDGSVFVGNQLVGQVGLAAFADVETLVPENNNLYRGEGAQPLAPAAVSVKQGYLEGSNVDENAQILEMMRILRLYEASQRTLQIHDSTLQDTLAVGQV
jgi:flagellar basal-body rod protein FlgF